MQNTNCNKCESKSLILGSGSCTSSKCETPVNVSKAAKEKAMRYLSMHGTKAAKYMQSHFQ